jgi:hypothetical protein
MAKPASRILVIDACVVGQAGSDQSQDPRSSSCHRFLLTVYESGHRIALSRTLRDEWKRHLSPRARSWLHQMYGSKQVEIRMVDDDVSLHKSVESCAANESERRAMLKDVHIIELALSTDRLIASCEGASRKLFQKAARRIVRIGTVAWVDPTIEAEQPITWLLAGAPSEEHRLLSRSQSK